MTRSKVLPMSALSVLSQCYFDRSHDHYSLVLDSRPGPVTEALGYNPTGRWRSSEVRTVGWAPRFLIYGRAL